MARKGPPPGTREPQVRCSFPVILPGGYKMSFHLKLHKYPAHRKTVITKATTPGKKNKKGLVSSEYPHHTLRMSFKGLLSPAREKNAQTSF